LIFTTSRRFPESARTNQGPGNGDLVLLVGILTFVGHEVFNPPCEPSSNPLSGEKETTSKVSKTFA
jgi:hypothetical protein